MKPGPAPTPIGVRLFRSFRVCPDTGCWLWTRYLANGYGSLSVNVGGVRKPLYAHRLMYELLVGPIPDGLHIDHLCRVRSCCNPAHLEPVTQAENNRRAFEKPCCIRGHDLSDERNVYIRPDNGRRQCRACRPERESEKRTGVAA